MGTSLQLRHPLSLWESLFKRRTPSLKVGNDSIQLPIHSRSTNAEREGSLFRFPSLPPSSLRHLPFTFPIILRRCRRLQLSRRIDCASPTVENDFEVEENQWKPRFETFETWFGFRKNVAAIQVVLRLTRFDSANNENVTKPKNARAMPKKCQMTSRCDASSLRIARWR